MKAHELRIGNWVKAFPLGYTYTGKKQEEIQVFNITTYIQEPCINLQYVATGEEEMTEEDDILPIPLDESWLNRTNLEVIIPGEEYCFDTNCYGYAVTQVKLILKVNHILVMVPDGYTDGGGGGEDVIARLDYVHELQNYYYVHRKEELLIKEVTA